MPIIVPAVNTLTVQNILDCASQDARSVLPTNSSVLIDYTNRISLDLLRHSRWRFVLSGVQSFTTTIGEDAYFIGSGAAPGGSTDVNLDITNIRSIKMDSVFDRTNERRLGMTEEAPLGTFFDSNGQPKLWRFDQDTPTIFNIYPAADAAYSIQFRYYESFTQLDDVSDELQIPADYKDVVCAGVNWLTAKFLRVEEDVKHWSTVYMLGKQQIVKDYNLFPRNGEYISPDVASVTTQFPLTIDTAGNF